MSDERELERSAALIEQLLADPELRRRFRADAAAVLGERGLAELASGLGTGRRALMTLELRESRSSLAGVMVGAAAEGVDFAHVAEHAAPGLAREAGRVLDRLVKSMSQHPARHAVKAVADHVSAPGAAGGAATTPAPPAAVAPAAVAPGASAHAAVAPGPVRTAPGPATDVTGGASSGGAGHHHATATGPLADAAPHVTESAAELLHYPGNDATPHQLAAWMGAHAKRAGLPPELPVMAALTESGLRNLNYGDRDSVGFFQMRMGIWNQGPYTGYLQDPQLQIKWFIEHALAVKAENPALAGDPGSWGQWVADIEQPAAQFRFRYQLQLGMAQELLNHAGLGVVHAIDALPPVGKRALEVALEFMGTPYQWGGSSPATGFDCSGLVQYAYAREGIQLPRVAAEQFDVGIPVARDHLKPGDAVFFADPGGYVHHVGLYIGDGKFVNAPETGEDVRIDSLSEPYFAQQYAGARQYSTAALGNPSSYARTLPTVGSS